MSKKIEQVHTKKSRSLTEGNPLKKIILFMLPMVAGNLFQISYNTADAIIVGRTLGSVALGGVGASGPAAMLFGSFAIWLMTGCAICTSQFAGAKNEERIRVSFAHDIMIGAVFSVLLTGAGLLSFKPLLRIMQTDSEVFGYAAAYLFPIIAGTPAIIAYNLFASTLRSLGDSKTPLYFLILAMLVNIGLDFLFILKFKWGVAGAAYATIISQAVSAAACAVYAMIRFPQLRVLPRHFKPDFKLFRKKMAYGLPMAFQILLIVVGLFFVQTSINKLGPAYTVAFAAASKVEQIAGQIMFSLGGAMTMYLGQNYGAKNMRRIDKGLISGNIIALAAGLGTAALVLSLSRPLTSLFMSQSGGQSYNLKNVYPIVFYYLSISSGFYAGLGILYVYRSAMQSTGHNLPVLIGGVVEMAVRIVCSSLALTYKSTLLTCLSSPLTWGLTALYYFLLYYLFIKKRVKKQIEEQDIPAPASDNTDLAEQSAAPLDAVLPPDTVSLPDCASIPQNPADF